MAQNISFSEMAALARSGDPQAQYALSSVLHQHERFDESLHWLRLAAAQKLAPAQITLATFLIDGRRCQRDRQQAIDLLQPLAASEIEAGLLLGELHGFSALGGDDRAAGLRLLRDTARKGHAGSIRQLAFLSVCHQQWHLVRPLFAAAARGGDVAAAHAAARCEAYQLGEQTEPASINWQLLDEILPRLAEDIRLPTAEVLHEAPLIRRLPGAIHPVLLDMLIDIAAPLVQPSKIVDPHSREGQVNSRRNSSNVTLSPRQHDHVLEALERCISRVAGVPPLNSEFLQIMRYRVGEQFKPHVDYFSEGGYGSNSSSPDDGQRAQTLLIYLNEGYEGGTTHFPRLQIEIKGRRGDMLHFRNVKADGLGDKESLHAGTPVLAGEKWLASQWIRDKRCPDRLAW